MRKPRQRRTIALLLAGLLMWPLTTLAAYARCLEAPHDCGPAPAILTCCCVDAADADQLSLTAAIVIVQGPAAGVGRTVATPRLTLTIGPGPAPTPPIDRLALFSLLLI